MEDPWKITCNIPLATPRSDLRPQSAVVCRSSRLCLGAGQGRLPARLGADQGRLLGHGETLNQNVDDTVKQALGMEPIPSPGMKNEPTGANLAKAAAKDAVERADAAEKVKKAFEKAAEETAQQNLDATKAAAKTAVKDAERHVDAVKDVGKNARRCRRRRPGPTDVITKATAKVVGEYVKMEDAANQRDAAITRWNEVEQEGRYGYAARSQYPGVLAWDDSLEGKLRSEWDALGTGRTWEMARPGVRRGWDYAS